MGWKKRRRDERRCRRRKEESRVNRGQVAPPDASRATTLLRPLAPSHPNDPATLLPPAPVSPLPPPLTSHAALLRALSKPPPRFYLRFLLAARAARGVGGGWSGGGGWVVNHPRATFGSHARTTAPRLRHLRRCGARLVRERLYDGLTPYKFGRMSRKSVRSAFFCSMTFFPYQGGRKPEEK